MSDSDNDLSDNVFTFQNEGSIVSANGPNINVNNLKGLSFRNNDLTSTMNMPLMSRNFEWQRRPASNYNQNTMWCRRETSPMSTASACDMRQRNYDNLFYSKALSSQRLNSERARSPTMSLRSIDSKVSAVDIITAIKQFRGSNSDMKRIQDVWKHKFRKHKTIRGIEKRRNHRIFLKGNRRESGNDSGELGSNSSMSSDDQKSTRTFNFKNMSSYRSTKTDITDIRRNIRDTDMVKDCTNNFRQNMLSMDNGSTKLKSIRSSVSQSRSMIDKPTLPKLLPPPNTNFNINHNQSYMNQSKFYRDRIKNRLILPSQRFNQSIAATSIPEFSSRHPVSQERNSDDEEIFSKPTSREKPTSNLRKRSIKSNDDICLPNKKKPKVDIVQNDFEFLKPACPVPKVTNIKSKDIIIPTSTNTNTTEVLISKSASLHSIQNNSKLEDENEDNTELQTTSQNNTDVSMRPSFMKRKLFSQNLDVTEKTNVIANSPQNSVYGKIQKEKNKARKLVTSQYCLSRDIHTEENNILDLIHKIVPAECMNATAQSNKTITQNKSEEKVNGDLTSIISARNNNEEDLSDTFTDEGEELSSPKTANNVCKSSLKNVQKSPLKVLLEKSPVKKLQKSQYKYSKLSKNILAEKNGTPTKGVEKMEKYKQSFWDTDFESDVEFTPASRKEIEKASKENKNTDAALSVAYKPAFQGISSMNPVNNATMINTTVDSTQKISNTNSIFKLCSHRISKPKKLASDKDNESTTQLKPLSSEQKNTNTNTRLEVTALDNNTQPVNKKTIKPKPERKKTPPKKQNKVKPVKNNTTNTGKESKIINAINDKTLGEENTKLSKQKNKKVQSKTESNDRLSTTQDKKVATASGNKIQNNPNKTKQTRHDKESQNFIKDKPPTQDKKGATASGNKIENNPNKTKQTRNDKESRNFIKDKPQINNVSKSKKPGLDIKDKNINNIKPCVVKINTTNPSDSLIYEDSFDDTNNNRSRPVRSCRLSKRNNTLDTSKVNQTLNVTLRSRLKNHDEKKPATKSSEPKEQANLSNLSFVVAQNKPISSIKPRLRETKKTDYSDSDISFSLTDKDSHLKSKGKSANFIKHVQTLTKQRMPLNTPNKKEFISKEPRPVRTSARISNRRYFF